MPGYICPTQFSCMHASNPTPWFTPALQDAIHAKTQAKRKADISKSDPDVTLYRN